MDPIHRLVSESMAAPSVAASGSLDPRPGCRSGSLRSSLADGVPWALSGPGVVAALCGPVRGAARAVFEARGG